MSLREILADMLLDAWESFLEFIRSLIEGFDAETYADVVVYDKDFNVKMVCWEDEDGKLRCVE